jgi:hypothetical protein
MSALVYPGSVGELVLTAMLFVDYVWIFEEWTVGS